MSLTAKVLKNWSFILPQFEFFLISIIGQIHDSILNSVNDDNILNGKYFQSLMEAAIELAIVAISSERTRVSVNAHVTKMQHTTYIPTICHTNACVHMDQQGKHNCPTQAPWMLPPKKKTHTHKNKKTQLWQGIYFTFLWILLHLLSY